MYLRLLRVYFDYLMVTQHPVRLYHGEDQITSSAIFADYLADSLRAAGTINH